MEREAVFTRLSLARSCNAMLVRVVIDSAVILDSRAALVGSIGGDEPPQYQRHEVLVSLFELRDRMNCVWRLCSFVAICLLYITVASAAPPANTTPDPALHAWFESLTQPNTGKRCCSISDCHFTSFTVRDGKYEVIIDGWPYVVPTDAVLHSKTNPTGRSIVCYGYTSFGPPVPRGEVRTAPQDTIEILCFLPFEALS